MRLIHGTVHIVLVLVFILIFLKRFSTKHGVSLAGWVIFVVQWLSWRRWNQHPFYTLKFSAFIASTQVQLQHFFLQIDFHLSERRRMSFTIYVIFYKAMIMKLFKWNRMEECAHTHAFLVEMCICKKWGIWLLNKIWHTSSFFGEILVSLLEVVLRSCTA